VGKETFTVNRKGATFSYKAGQARPTVRNTGKSPLFAHVSLTYTPAAGQEEEVEKGLSLNVEYVNEMNQPLDPRLLKKGESFATIITVSNNTGQYISNIALAQPVAAGWEIGNERLASSSTEGGETQETGVTYTDIRDDRIHRFFTLQHGKSLTVKTRLTAAYAGTYSLPSIVAEAMYQPQYQAVRKGGKVEVR
jgi:uncharacterized protein YfaS (alpha-2-macroglobulin family)